MCNYVQSKKCKREIILNCFGFKVLKRNGFFYECCDFYEEYCDCDDCIIVIFLIIFEEFIFQCDLVVIIEDSLNVGFCFKILDFDI